MADKITTLHPENDTSINLYPNVKDENIPNTIARVSYVDEGDNENDLAISAVRADLDTEIGDRKKDTADTNGRIDGLATDISVLETRITDLGYEIRGISEELTEEITNRKNADTALSDNILTLYHMVIRSGGTITTTDAGVALVSQSFPSSVSPKALLNYVGGMCQKEGNSILTAPVTKVASKNTNGDVAKEYPIPTEVQALDGYGFGINADCYNYIDFENKKFVKKVKKSNIGDLPFASFSARETCNCIEFTTEETTRQNGGTVENSALSDKFVYATNGWVDPISLDSFMWMPDKTTIRFTIGVEYNTKEKALAYVANHEIVYMLAMPVETDISEYLDRDLPDNDVIDVTAGGHLEFENENNVGVPYSVTYQSKPETQGE